MSKSYDWDATIEADGGLQELIEAGTYPFTVVGMTRKRFGGSGKIPSCNMAEVELEVGPSPSEHTAHVKENLHLCDVMEWKLCQFFTAIGARAHGERMVMDWDSVVGKTGMLDLGTRTYESKAGKEIELNSVEKFLAPGAAPAAPPATPDDIPF